jgi:ribonuclease HI
MAPRQVKVNVDAAYHEDEHAGAIGVVLRDYQGNFLAAKSSYFPYVYSAAMAESLAMKEGLPYAMSISCNNIIIESDSIETIEACTGEEIWWNESAAVFADCVDLASEFDMLEFKYCPREANQVAHEIAKISFLNKKSCIWVDEPPSFLMSITIL